MIDIEKNLRTFLLDDALGGEKEKTTFTLAVPQGARIYGVERHGTYDLMLSVFVDEDIACTELRTFLVVKGQIEDLMKETLGEAPGTPIGSIGLPGQLMVRTYELNG